MEKLGTWQVSGEDMGLCNIFLDCVILKFHFETYESEIILKCCLFSCTILLNHHNYKIFLNFKLFLIVKRLLIKEIGIYRHKEENKNKLLSLCSEIKTLLTF